MATTFQLVGLLWIFVAVGPFFLPGGSDSRRQMREGLPDFWKRSASYPFPFNHAARALFAFAYALWLFPTTRPGWGVAGGFFMVVLSAAFTSPAP